MTVLLDFQQHYTPSELMEAVGAPGALRLDDHGNPEYRFNPLLSDLRERAQMMDHAGIDMAVLSCGSGFDQPSASTCRFINDRLHDAEAAHPGRFIGLAHVPALDEAGMRTELKRCAVELGFPGVAIASEIQGLSLDASELQPFWHAVADLDLYVFVHPLPRVIGWSKMNADDLGRMLGWEFSLMVAAVRLINSGILDELPRIRVQFAHFAGGIGRYLPRIRGLQDRKKSGTALIGAHSRQPKSSFEYYLAERLFYDCAGWTGQDNAARNGTQWVASGMSEVPASRVVFATDYPQAVCDSDEVKRYVCALDQLGMSFAESSAVAELIPDIQKRAAKRKPIA